MTGFRVHAIPSRSIFVVSFFSIVLSLTFSYGAAPGIWKLEKLILGEALDDLLLAILFSL